MWNVLILSKTSKKWFARLKMCIWTKESGRSLLLVAEVLIITACHQSLSFPLKSLPHVIWKQEIICHLCVLKNLKVLYHAAVQTYVFSKGHCSPQPEIFRDIFQNLGEPPEPTPTRKNLLSVSASTDESIDCCCRCNTIFCYHHILWLWEALFC